MNAKGRVSYLPLPGIQSLGYLFVVRSNRGRVVRGPACTQTDNRVITVRNEVAKVKFLQVSVCPQGGGIPACFAGGIPACLAAGLQGVPAPGEYLLWGGCSRGGLVETPPASRWLLLRTVRILLECILVL